MRNPPIPFRHLLAATLRLLEIDLPRFLQFLLMLLLATGLSAQAASVSNIRVRSDSTPLTEDRVFPPPGPGAVTFNKPTNTLWKGDLTRGGSVIVDRNGGNGYSTPEFSFGDLPTGDYSLNIRLLGNPTKTVHFSVKRASPVSPPSITRQPEGTTVCVGTPVTIAAEATGTAPLQFQWKLNGVPISGATSSMYSFDASESTAGSYSLAVSNSAGGTESNAAQVSVFRPVSAQPVTDPAPARVGDLVSLSPDVSGDSVVYSWLFNGAPINGATDPSYSISNIQLSDAGTYTLTASGPCNSVTLDFHVVVIEPVIFTLQPVGGNAGVGQLFTFRAAAKGALHYQWYFQGAEIPGETSNTLTLPNVQAANAGPYRIDAFDANGNPTSSEDAVLTVAIPPKITKQPHSITVGAGEPFSLDVECDDPGAVFLWIKDGVELGNQVDSSLSRDGAELSDAGSYVCVVSNAGGLVRSTAAKVTVRRIDPPVISQQPASLKVGKGGAAVFRVRASGSGPLSYQWFGNGEEAGSESDTLTITDVTSDTGGQYYVIVSNGGGSVTSKIATLTVESGFSAGQYGGLFYVAGAVAHESSGSIKLTLAKDGRFTASAQIGLSRYSAKGQFDGEGSARFRATSSVRGAQPLDVSLTLGDGDQIEGDVTSGDWDAEVQMDRSVFSRTSPCPAAGTYTVLLPPNESIAEAPAAYGYAAITIASDGKVTATGKFADGAPLAASSFISSDGNVPLYVPLYSGKGSALSWFNVSDESVSGLVSWIKPTTTTGSYPDGFATEIESLGAPYDQAQSSLPEDAALVLDGATLAEPISVSLHVGPNNKITADQSGVRVQIGKNGLFSGSVFNAETHRPITFSGALYQANEAGFGFFQSGGQSGEVYIGDSTGLDLP